ncbi:hypothetical protein ABFS82_06G187300 [Erythranthe guttata]|uniref:SKP1-like protein n=1 Tax=Erythranthe guttata TaxID=4155 RepID=A0A022RIQ7_ERYGU|nr:PREDICTED: SKP1-like protein 11 [Erythranthe guttata]EYU39628.1 hypothetical protein MIMGU_mgv1a015244mg [Erythranthe guttata]|eukprot:XP_012834572.1 PREDICTED: SKP1-like protein 11 [Erythranthe guttata]
MAAETGTPTTLTLKSNDDELFSVAESAAILSVTIRNMVEDGCAGGVIPLDNVDGKTLASVITYMNGISAIPADEEKKKSYRDKFLSDKDFETLADMVLAANYLNMSCLMDAVSAKIAQVMEKKSVGWVRRKFGIENDYTPEEEAAVKEEHKWTFEGVETDDDN